MYVIIFRSGEFMCMEYLTGKRPKCTIRNCEFAIVPHDAHGSREYDFFYCSTNKNIFEI